MDIKVIKQVIEDSTDCSNDIKNILRSKNVYLINVMGSPGTGKTSVIIELINSLKSRYNIAVVEGDIAGKVDAEKIDALGISVVQLNTEGACHIEPLSIKNILQYFDLDEIDIIFVENVGNLVCPAEYDIGADLKLAILSIPEGDDKIEKYPLLFTEADITVLNKYDMLQYFEFDHNKVEENIIALNPTSNIFRVSTRTKEGIAELSKTLEDNLRLVIGK
jgi:hydrogenase nickel incorporation protein HypB